MFGRKLKPIPDAEFDLENSDVYAIDRTGRRNETWIGYKTNAGIDDNVHLYCSMAKHDELVQRFRTKLKLEVTPLRQ